MTTPKMRTLEITLKVTIPQGYEVSDHYVPEHIQKLLDVGQDAADESLVQHDVRFDDPDAAEIAANLIFSDITVSKPSYDPV